MKTEASRSRTVHVATDERGSILIQVAVALMALLALSSFVFDYGVMWVSRAQVQNAADAGALAAAQALAFDNPTDQAGARAKALAVARRNLVWRQTPDVVSGDVTFVGCPPATPVNGTNCLQIRVFKNGRNGPALPVFFSRLGGVTTQGVQATAAAQVLLGDRADCVKPWAIPDRWIDDFPAANPPWTTNDDFQRYVRTGRGRGSLITPLRDRYTTGFTVQGDYGIRLTLSRRDNAYTLEMAYFPVAINTGRSYQSTIEQCDQTVVAPGAILQEPTSPNGGTLTGNSARTLIQADAGARWSTTANGGRGAPIGGCMAAGTCPNGISPRLVPIVAFNPDVFDLREAQGLSRRFTVTRILGFWLEDVPGSDLVGYLTHYPARAEERPVAANTAFLRTAILVR